MRIAMLGWEFPPVISGGLATHCYALTKNLAALGVEIDFFMPDSGRAVSHPWLNIVQVPLKYVQRNSFNSYTTVHAKVGQAFGGDFFGAVNAFTETAADEVVARHREHPYDLIHAHDWLTIRAALAAKRRTGLKTVFTVHSTETDRTGGTPFDAVDRVERQGVSDADAVIAVSERTRVQLVDALGASPDKTRVIYNAIEPGAFATHDNRAALKARLGFGQDKIALFYGRLSVQKGPEFFLHAAKLVLQQEPRARFIVAGKGDLLPKLVQLASDLGISDKVTFTGFLPQDDVPLAFAASDVYVMPSVAEPFGITALESMAAGTPVIVSKTAGVAEVATHVLRVDFWDTHDLARKILAVFSYPELSTHMSEQAGRQTKGFTWRDVALQTLHTYQDVTGHDSLSFV